MIHYILSFASGFMLSKFFTKRKQWYTKENSKFIRLDCSDVINYLHKDYIHSKDDALYEFSDFIVDFKNSKIKFDNDWQNIYMK